MGFNSVFKGLLLDVLCRSTCFVRFHTHHQKLTTALAASGFTLERGGSSVIGRGLAGYDRQDHDQQHCYNLCYVGYSLDMVMLNEA
jgi:hypothetical protein